MFFTIVIPTYNPRKFLPTMLESITHNDCIDDMEVIIADDCSTEDFYDIITEYRNKLKIRVIYNKEHWGAPLLGRQNGLDNASGKWVCFADQDDFWLDNAFDMVKEYIEKENCHRYLITDFYEKINENEYVDHIKAMNWTHANFYEYDFMKKYNICYPNNIKYCEDIALSVRISCELAKINEEPCYYPCFTYVWVQRPDSLSQANGYSSLGYFYKSFPNYINCTLGHYVYQYEKNKENVEFSKFIHANVMDLMFHFYFYFQGLQCHDHKKLPRKYYSLLNKYLRKYLKLYGLNLKEWLSLCKINAEQYSHTREICFNQIPFIEEESFYKWIKKIKWYFL